MRDHPPDVAAVEIAGLTKRYGAVRALDGVDLRIAPGAYFVLLGPSGGGKTTLLRAIGGFIRPDAGAIRLNGEDVADLPPDRRPTCMVFQAYALFPHMTVAQNVGYGLSLRKKPKADLVRAVETGLAQVGLAGYGERRIWELSGGQQQRVQLARALVLRPSILLLDEPLAALDAKLRKEMCYELKALQETVGITFIHVTHNQEEAMTVGDRIALIADGRLVEEGAPREIYETPRRRFTAGFIGERMILRGRVRAVEGGVAQVETPCGAIAAPLRGASAAAGDTATVSVRGEALTVAGPETARPGASLPARYREAIYLGLVTQHQLTLSDGATVSARQLSGADVACAWRSGEEVALTWRPEDALLHVD